MGGGIAGGLGYVLGNRLKNPTAVTGFRLTLLPQYTFTRRAFMSFHFGLFGALGVLLTGLKVIRGFSLGRSE